MLEDNLKNSMTYVKEEMTKHKARDGNESDCSPRKVLNKSEQKEDD